MAEYQDSDAFVASQAEAGWRPDATAAKANAAAVRQFGSGATRDVDTGKNDYEAFLSPAVIAAYGGYMNACRMTATGMRDGDNWQRGIPLDTYMKSNWRHFFALWAAHRGQPVKDPIAISCLAVMFNTMGYLHEYMKAHPGAMEAALSWFEEARSAEIASRQKPAG